MIFKNYENQLDFNTIPLSEYRVEHERLKAKFKADAFAELEISDHPKAEAAFELAWDLGHAAGYLEVFMYLRDISVLLK